MWFFVIGFFHLVSCYQYSFMFEHLSGLHLFLLMNNIPLYKYTTFYLLIHKLTDIWTVPTFLGIMNNDAMNICVQVLYGHSFSVFLTKYWNGIIGPYHNSMLNNLKNYPLFSKAAETFYSFRAWGFQFLYILINTCNYLSFFILATHVSVKWYLVWFRFALSW